ncbi:MAG: hypothetical protein CMA72_09350 [Euryarchaeota archaeon]|nr:hypothetical protein [Euryarchaeota archaeon]|tara:strand:- start:2680 stop:4194 length:1515 start_codon:yes stop_codon:yes gene_type:complete
MKNSMYEQAILDAQNLRKMAEESAKNKLIEAVMPQLREIIENDVISPVVSESMEIEEDHCMNDAEEKENDDLLLDENEDDEDDMNEADMMALAALVEATSHQKKGNLNERLSIVRKKLARMLVISESIDPKQLQADHAFVFMKKLNALIKETMQIKNEAILIKESGDHRFYNKSDKTLQEIKEMARRMNRGVFARLFEADKLNELDATLVLEPSEDEADEVEELLGDLDIDVELGGADEDEDEDDAGDMDADEEEDDEEIELDLGEADMDEMDHGKKEGYHEMDEMDEMDEDMDEVYEIDESTLRRALRALREGDAAEKADQFGGAEVEGDVIVDLDEDDLLHALNDVLGDAPVPRPPLGESRRSRRKSRRSRVNESRKNRTLISELSRAKKANGELKKHLQEMNLFNAKLLYANKLMQNKSLSTRQQRAVVEALDSAKTLREAKLLFQSLSSGVKKGKALSESTSRVRGSSSKSTPRASAKPLQEGAGQTDRWAILAGIPGKK